MTSQIAALPIIFPENELPISIENLPIGPQPAESCVSVTLPKDVSYITSLDINNVAEGLPEIIKYEILPWQQTDDDDGDLIISIQSISDMVIHKISIVVSPQESAVIDEPGVHTIRIGETELLQFEMNVANLSSVFDSVNVNTDFLPVFKYTKTFKPGLLITTNLEFQIPEGTYDSLLTYGIYVCASGVDNISSSTNVIQL